MVGFSDLSTLQPHFFAHGVESSFAAPVPGLQTENTFIHFLFLLTLHEDSRTHFGIHYPSGRTESHSWTVSKREQEILKANIMARPLFPRALGALTSKHNIGPRKRFLCGAGGCRAVQRALYLGCSEACHGRYGSTACYEVA